MPDVCDTKNSRLAKHAINLIISLNNGRRRSKKQSRKEHNHMVAWCISVNGKLIYQSYQYKLYLVSIIRAVGKRKNT